MTAEGFGKKIRTTPRAMSEAITQLRAEWADYANHQFKQEGFDVRISSLSHKARGIELQPTLKVGKATHMQNSQQQKIRVAQNQVIRAQNALAIEAKPDLLISSLTQAHHVIHETHVQAHLEPQIVHPAIINHVRHAEDSSAGKADQ